MIKDKAKGTFFGVMEWFIEENGKMMLCMVLELLLIKIIIK